MTDAALTLDSAPDSSAREREERGAYLFGPVVDFLGLGGASLVMLAALALFSDPAMLEPQLAITFLLLANVINHPHFAHSYQIFYRDFARKLGPETDWTLRWRYWVAGIAAPIAIMLFYGAALFMGRVEWVGYSINVMAFLVGWHYVKQGYGMLSVDSVLKKKFFDAGEKRLLLNNAYATWAFSYVLANEYLVDDGMFGVSRYAFRFPEPVYWLTFALMAGFGAATLLMFARRAMPGGKGLPVNGTMAYLTSLYVWQVAIRFNPLFALVVPAFHSFQYMLVVSRFQLNVEAERAANGHRAWMARLIRNAPVAGLVQFYLIGAVLGFLAFWCLPFAVTAVTDMEAAGYPAAWAFAVFWIFINVHHYLLDNVMWRKGNPDVARHLFAHR